MEYKKDLMSYCDMKRLISLAKCIYNYCESKSTYKFYAVNRNNRFTKKVFEIDYYSSL